ncbi:hypothetical protein [Pseudidiomarina terrestris]|uniref:hypothetical protein n=1 Tax=Pseudidiomarina terrestris TaxID=2820060 RepID=UPI00264A5BEB|nr:hypothetical protein [Pseudidiomarina sp. 1ASP75-5]MDN7135361.1 hypothetical protein [Pseudidiomarina sp. 1ASP75-5]
MFEKLKDDKMVTVFDPIDFEAPKPDSQIEELNIEGLATQQGRYNNPPANATSPDANELSITQHFILKASQATLKVKDSYNILRAEIAATSVDVEMAEIKRLPSSFEEKAKAKRSIMRSELTRSHDELVALEDEMGQFRKDNRIKREASYPDSHVMTVSIFAILLIVESMLNGYFFARGNELGLLGGMLQAFIVSVVNLGTGFLLGFFCMRQLNHIAPWRKYVFGSVAIILSFTIIMFNLLVGHFRTALAQEPENAARLSWESFTENILALGEFDSWMLFAIGLLIAIIVAIKSYSADDKYPGYGHLARKLVSAKEDLDDLHAEWHEILQDLFSGYEDKLDSLYKACQKKARKLDNYHNAIQQQVAILEHYILSLKSTFQTCITQYRQTNQQYRETPAPGYFSVVPELHFEHDFKPTDIEDKRAELHERLQELSSKLPEIRGELSQIFEAQSESIKTK